MGNITKKFASIAISVATVASLSGFSMLVPVAHAQTSLQAQIDALLAQIAALQSQLASSSPVSTALCSFTRDLTLGVRGDDVMCLQKYLNSTGHKVSTSGPGSIGNETSYFGALTASAVAKWQAANGVAPAAGYFGRISRAKYASLAVVAPAPAPAPVPGTPAPVPSGSGLTVTLASDQPSNGLFGESFASRPFTKLTLRASADGDVTVKAMVVERTGQGSDAAFSGVIATDESGLRLGPSKTFGSDHRLRLTEKVVVKAGQTRTIVLAGDSDSDQNDYNGQLVSLSLVGVETEGATAVNASFPMTGATHTVNSTLAIGSMTIARGAFDPGSGLTKEIGTVGYTFSGLRLNAGTNEDVLVKAIQWNQSGSAGLADLTNVKVVLDGTTYDVTSTDGKDYVAKFGAGLKIEKGLSKEVYIKGDVAGGSARTVDFDLFRYSDIQVVGLTYGYALLPSGTEIAADNDDDGEIQDAEPRFDAYQVHIGAGSISAQNAPTVGSQNVAVNLSNQPLGGLLIDVKGEDVTVAAMNFDLSIIESTSQTDVDTNDITNITLVDENGKVVAGPVDAVAGGNNAIRFSDTVTFKPGRMVYTLKGKVGTDVGTNDTIAASTTPNSDWTTVRGVTSAVTITPTPSSAVTMSTMTVKAASLSITLSSDTQQGVASSTAQTVVSGTSGYTFTQYVLDASGSGEDLRINAMQLLLTFSSANAADDLTNCQLFDGATALNTGGNIVNPSNSDSTGAAKTFSFDSSLIVAKGTVKTLSMKCNLVSGAASGHYWNWGIADADASINSTGMTSGQTVDGSDAITADNGRIVIAATSGTLSLVLDASSPSLKWAQSGSTDNILAVFRLNATNESVRVDTLGLQLATSTNSSAVNGSSTPSDLTKVTLWVGALKVGEVVFTASDYATATLSGVTVPKDGQVLITAKGDIGNIGTGLSARPGHLVNVNYDASNSSDESNLGAIGVGLSSGTTISAGGSDTGSNGARIARAIPTVSKEALASNTFSNSSNQALYRFKVTAPSGGNGVSLYKMTFAIATSTLSSQETDGQKVASTYRVTNFDLYCYENAAFSVASCNTFDNSGLLNQGGLANASHDKLGLNNTNEGAYSSSSPSVSVRFNPTDTTQGSTAEAIRLAAGETKYFVLQADVTGGTNTPSITVRMDGDATFASLNDSTDFGADATGEDKDFTNGHDNWSTGRYVFATTASIVDAWDNDDFIWSGNSTNTSQGISSYDWFNGFLVPGLSNSDNGATEVLTL
ncbi:MAG: peptidoglycan-binding domain-containing protein [bacterium]|nr:peptidoglycan-binding domain-containing protein [bacterium]